MTTITLANLNDATAQDVFNQVVTHLIKQGVKSGKYDEDGSYGCYYRHPENSNIKCAAGCLISDEEYNYESMDSRELPSTLWLTLVGRGTVPNHHSDLISSLQEIHDNKPDTVHFTVQDFKELAEEYGLELPVINPQENVMTEKKYTLIKFKKDWSDEFDCQSYVLFEGSIEEAKEHVSEEISDPWGIYFGTNEGWEEGELTLDDFTFTDITLDEYSVLTRLLGKKFGVGYKR